MKVQLSNIERAAAIGTRDSGCGLRTELRRKATERPNPRQGLRSSVPAGVPRRGRAQNLHLRVDRRLGRVKENRLYVLGWAQENGPYVSVNRRLARVMRPCRCRKSVPVTVASKMWLDMASLPRERAFCFRNA
jgi:hypothetical protein